MTRTRGRRPLACHHEAGHAVARWWLGFHGGDVVVLTVDEVRAGVMVMDRYGNKHRCEGLAEGDPIFDSLALDFLNCNADIDRDLYTKKAQNRYEMALVEWCSGVYAEAYYSKKSARHCLSIGGQGDLEGATAIVKAWFTSGDACQAALERAERVSKAMVRSPLGWAAVETIAAALLDRGRINGDDVDALCSATYGAPFSYDRWAETWPPTSAQIRSGIVPRQAEPQGDAG